MEIHYEHSYKDWYEKRMEIHYEHSYKGLVWEYGLEHLKPKFRSGASPHGNCVEFGVIFW